MVKTPFVLALIVAIFATACGLNLNTEQAKNDCIDELTQNPSTGVPTASSSGQAAQGGAGGEGGGNVAPECRPETVADDCGHLGTPDPRCGSLQCIADKCELEIKPGPIESQKYGDCKQVVCDVLGHLIEMRDGADTFNDGNQCTLDYCDDEQPKNEAFPDGWGCPEAGEGYCYQGKCEECVVILPQATCKGAGMVCTQLYCEQFVDCMGKCGGNCAPCAVGQACIAASDCFSGVCTSGMCQTPTCTDGVKNDGETGLDCGAQSCPTLCPTGEGCNSHDDCQSGVCMGATCQAPTCTDGTQNGDEVGIDCGGSCPAACVGQ